MSDEPADETPAAAAPAGPRPPKVVLGLLVANLAISGFVLFKTLNAEPPHVGSAHADTPHDKSNEISGPIAELEPFVVNLNEPGSSRYLKVHLQFELRDGAAAKAFEKSKILVRDQILGYLSGLKVADTLGPDNKDKIRDELVARIGELLGKERVKRLIFAEFVVQ